MIQAAGIGPGDTVLEVGAGSGYAAAVISRIADKVIAIERQHDLVEVARERLARLGYDNVEIVEGDGTGAGPTRRRSTRSSPRRAAAMSRRRWSPSSRPAAGW